jgi:hypothetical protein
MNKGKSKPKSKPNRLKPLSLYPLTPEQALSAFMRTDPAKVKAAERRAQKKSRAVSTG